MEYHQDRFEDYSLLIFKEEKLMAVLPANRVEDKLISHQGLTYGGFVLGNTIKLPDVIACFREILSYLVKKEINSLELKKLPNIYSSLPSLEVDFMMFKLGATLIRCDVTSSINYSNRLEITSSNRRRSLKRGIDSNLDVKQDQNFDLFWKEILEPNLSMRHRTAPTHSLDEIKHLSELFPNNIKQFNTYKEDKIVAGVTIFETRNVAHVQYISANEEKQELGSLDFLFNFLINLYADKKVFFDFGVSSENKGQQINEGLLSWKESFGARSISHPVYRIETKNYELLSSILI